MTTWVYCPKGSGRLIEDGVTSPRTRYFPPDSVGLLRKEAGDLAIVWLIGTNEEWAIPKDEVVKLDVLETGDKKGKKICNRCHCLLPVERFKINQRNKHGLIRRPTCTGCRDDIIDKRPPSTNQAKEMENKRPKKGEPFKCPICAKRTIAYVTAKIVADHNHRTGDIRDFICESCNTGLGRFQNGKDCVRNLLEYLKEHDKDQR